MYINFLPDIVWFRTISSTFTLHDNSITTLNFKTYLIVAAGPTVFNQVNMVCIYSRNVLD